MSETDLSRSIRDALTELGIWVIRSSGGGVRGIDRALRNPDAVENFLRQSLHLPDGFCVSVQEIDSLQLYGFSVALVDGCGLGCRYWRETFYLGPEKLRDPGEFVRALVQRVESAMLAMCEHPERFAAR